jgi:hypothetical protein
MRRDELPPAKAVDYQRGYSREGCCSITAYMTYLSQEARQVLEAFFINMVERLVLQERRCRYHR